MKGGYYTSLYSLRAAPTTPHQRVEAVGMAPGDVRPSYSVSLLLRLVSYNIILNNKRTEFISTH